MSQLRIEMRLDAHAERMDELASSNLVASLLAGAALLASAAAAFASLVALATAAASQAAAPLEPLEARAAAAAVAAASAAASEGDFRAMHAALAEAAEATATCTSAEPRTAALRDTSIASANFATVCTALCAACALGLGLAACGRARGLGGQRRLRRAEADDADAERQMAEGGVDDWWALRLRAARVFLLTARVLLRYALCICRCGWASAADAERLWERTHDAAGALLAPELSALGGLWTKFGQYLGSRSDGGSVPSALLRHLRHVHHKQPVAPLSEVTATLLHEIDVETLASIAAICPEPYAVASIAQVHLAWLHTGRKIVVKVQHRGLERTTQQDVRHAQRIARLLARLSATIDYVAGVDEACAQHSLEVNFRNEAANLAAVRAGLVGACVSARAPEVIASTPHVLILSFCEGRGLPPLLQTTRRPGGGEAPAQSRGVPSAGDAPVGADPASVPTASLPAPPPPPVEPPPPTPSAPAMTPPLSSHHPSSPSSPSLLSAPESASASDAEAWREAFFARVVEAWSVQVFVHGLFQSDPSPSTLLVTDSALLGPLPTLLDFGLCKRLTEAERLALCRVVHALVEADVDMMAGALNSVGFSFGAAVEPVDVMRALARAGGYSAGGAVEEAAALRHLPFEVLPGVSLYWLRVVLMLQRLGTQLGVNDVPLIEPMASCARTALPRTREAKGRRRRRQRPRTRRRGRRGRPRRARCRSG